MKTDKELTRIVIEPDSIKAALALFEKYRYDMRHLF